MTDNPNAFKHWFDEPLVRRIADAFGRVDSGFPVDQFVTQCLTQLPALELKERVAHISECLHDSLSPNFSEAIATILEALPAVKTDTEDIAEHFEVWPYCHYVEVYGLQDPDVALPALVELTQRFSAEFAIRPFLASDPITVIAWLESWIDHPNPHVRRWVSEGTRPRLPWGLRLKCFVTDPAPVLGLLERLWQDDSEYVRRSVANNLNDIAKDHPEVVVATCERWWSQADENGRRLVKHALRSLVKQGDRGALAVLGYAECDIVVASFSVSPTQAQTGDSVQLTAEFGSNADQALLIDYRVHHQRANGSTSAKVFKWTKRRCKQGEAVTLRKAHSLKVVTTRRYYAGAHVVELLVNGDVVAQTQFELSVQ